jgi:hypothetical protein
MIKLLPLIKIARITTQQKQSANQLHAMIHSKRTTTMTKPSNDDDGGGGDDRQHFLTQVGLR